MTTVALSRHEELLMAASTSRVTNERAARVQPAMQRAMDFLRRVQQPDGSFLISKSLSRRLLFGIPDRVPAVTGMILQALSIAPVCSTADPMAQRAATFLQQQMESSGLFHTHARGHRFHQAVPPILEDTCINLLALEAWGHAPVAMVSRLMSYQTAEGLFPLCALSHHEVESIVSQQAGGRRINASVHALLGMIDPVSNATILEYLARHGCVPHALCEELMRRVKRNAIEGCSPFYESPLVFFYRFSRAYAAGAEAVAAAMPLVQQRVVMTQRPDGSWGHALETALAISSLVNGGSRGEALDRGVTALLHAQRPDGGWKGTALFRLPRPTLWFGSDALSTGFALEALGRYAQAIDRWDTTSGVT